MVLAHPARSISGIWSWPEPLKALLAEELAACVSAGDLRGLVYLRLFLTQQRTDRLCGKTNRHNLLAGVCGLESVGRRLRTALAHLGILLGTAVVTVVFFIVWPEYAGDSLLPRLRKVIRDAIALAPGGPSSAGEATVEAANSETMHLLAQILEIADDARLEGRASLIDHDAVAQAAGTLRRIGIGWREYKWLVLPFPCHSSTKTRNCHVKRLSMEFAGTWNGGWLALTLAQASADPARSLSLPEILAVK